MSSERYSFVRAAESVVSPLGWTAADVRRRLRDADDASLAAYW